jgi:hypothetical protein
MSSNPQPNNLYNNLQNPGGYIPCQNPSQIHQQPFQNPNYPLNQPAPQYCNNQQYPHSSNGNNFPQPPPFQQQSYQGSSYPAYPQNFQYYSPPPPQNPPIQSFCQAPQYYGQQYQMPQSQGLYYQSPSSMIYPTGTPIITPPQPAIITAPMIITPSQPAIITQPSIIAATSPAALISPIMVAPTIHNSSSIKHKYDSSVQTKTKKTLSTDPFGNQYLVKEKYYKPKNSASLSFSIDSSELNNSFSISSVNSDESDVEIRQHRRGKIIDYSAGGRC